VVGEHFRPPVDVVPDPALVSGEGLEAVFAPAPVGVVLAALAGGVDLDVAVAGAGMLFASSLQWSAQPGRPSGKEATTNITAV
jgi:hypothetical protein